MTIFGLTLNLILKNLVELTLEPEESLQVSFASSVAVPNTTGYQWECSECEFRIGIRSGTFIEHSKLPFLL